jgi:hypothetical protein
MYTKFLTLLRRGTSSVVHLVASRYTEFFLAQDRDRWRLLVNMIMSLSVA